MLDVVSDDDASDKELEILEDELVLGPDDTVEIHLAILRDICIPKISTSIGDEVLNEEHVHDKVGAEFGGGERVKNVLVVWIILKVIEDRTTLELHLDDALVVVDDASVLRHIEIIQLAAPLLIKIVFGDLPDDVSCDPMSRILFINESFSLTRIYGSLALKEVALCKLDFDFNALVIDSSLLAYPFFIGELFWLLCHFLEEVIY